MVWRHWNSKKGQCISLNSCSCPIGYGGLSCEWNSCFGKNENDSTVCSSRGVCSGPNHCDCPYGYGGEYCQHYRLILDSSLSLLTSVNQSLLLGYKSFTGSCKNYINSEDYYLLGDDSMVCLWNSSYWSIYLGYGYQLNNMTVIRTNINGLSFLIETSSTNLFSGSGVNLYKMITSPPRNQYLIMKAKINPTFQAYRNVSISWSCSECTQTFRPYLTGDLLYLPSSLVHCKQNDLICQR